MTKLHCAPGLYVGEELRLSLQAGLLCWYWPTVCCFAPCEPPFQQSLHLLVWKRSNNHNATRKVPFSKWLFIYSYSTLSQDSINHVFKLYCFKKNNPLWSCSSGCRHFRCWLLLQTLVATAAVNHVPWQPDTNANTANYTTHHLVMAPALLYGTVAGFRCHTGCNVNAALVFGRLLWPNEQKSANRLCVYVTRWCD